MNKIYKVIWSKVKHQYVVVSELAHSNGKQSRTAKRSLRSRIAALVVCGAIAAFGVFGTQNVMAAEPEGGLATIDQYVAYKYNQGDGNQRGYKKVFVRDKNSTNPGDGQYYWVRNGYTVEGEYVQKQDGTGTTFVISKVYAPNGNISDVLVTSDVTIDGTGVVTNSGEELNSVELGNYAAVSNGGKGGAEANTECHYIIETENGWENVGVGTDKFDEYFKTVDNDSENGLKYDNEKGVYTYNGEVVSSDNIYYIKDGDTVNAGVFVVNGEVYKSTVYGNTKEILTTVKDEDGSLKTFWSTEAESSDIYLKDSNIKVSDLNTAFDTIEANEKRLENNDIREITVTPNENKIGLVRNSDKEVDGSIYVSSVVGENGNAQVKFAQKGEDGQETSSFVVDAGSIVKANPEGATSGTKLSTVAINGINYQLATGISGGEVGDDGTVYITQEGSTEKTPIGKIEVVGTDVNVTSEQTTNDDGVKGIKYTVSNNLSVDGTASAEHKNGGNWTVTDNKGTPDSTSDDVTLTNTTLVGGTVEKRAIQDNAYGSDYLVKDTDGNTATLSDVASATKLKEVAGEAGKHTTIKETGKNVTVVKNETEDGHLDYTVNLNDDVTLGNADKNIHLDGTNGNVTATGFVQAGNVTVNADGAGTIKGLTNKEWNGTSYVSGQAATEDQLKTVSDKANKADVEAGKHTTIKETGKNVTVVKNETEDGHLDYTVNLNDDVTLGNADKNIHLDGTNGNVTATGFVQAGNVTVNADGAGTIKGLTNKEWNGTSYVSGQAATEDQLKTVSDKANKADVEAGKHTTIKETGKNVTVVKNETEDGHLDYTVNLNDDVTLGNADKNIHLDGTNGNVTATGFVQAGNVTVNADGAGTIKGLTNKEWNGTSYVSGQAATEDQLKTVSDKANKADVEAGKHTTIKETGKNVTVVKNETEDGHLDYTVDLNDDVTLDGNIEDSNKINLSGTEGTIDVVKANGSTNINGGIITVSSGTGEGSKAIKIDGTTAEITGLSNTTLGDGSEDSTFAKVGRAATEEQLQAAMTKIDEGSYKGWNVTTNKGTKTAEVASDGSVDFSNTDGNIIVGQDGTNLTFDLNDNITLGDESGTRIQLNGNPQKDSMISITNKDSDTVFNIAKDGTVHSDGDIVAKADSNKKYSLSEVGENAVRYNNEDKSTVALAGTSGTTITNVADGALNGESTEAVNGSQLYAVDQKVNDGWTAKVGDDEINVRPNGENETGKDTLSFAGDNNITVTADSENNAINVKLNPDLTLAGETKGNSIKLSGTGGYAQVVQGNTYTDIQGGTVTVGSDINGVNKKIVIDGTTGEMTGLSNTTVDYEGFATEGKAATEEQLKQAAAASKTTVSNGKNTTVTSNTDTDDGHVDYQVNLNDNVTLGTGDNQISINGAPKVNDPALSIGNKFVVEQNGTTTIIADDGINNRPGQAQLTPDTTVTIAPSGVTFAGDDKGTTIIEGQKITAGGIVINGEDIYDKTTGIVTKGTITGLSNTTWDGKTDNASRVATEGQLEDLSDTVNTGWIATDSQNHEVNITPDNNKLNFAGDENVTVTAANNEIKTTLNDDIVLGDYLNGDDGVLIGGSSGTISATNSITVGEDQGLIIDGQKKEIQGLSNTTWNEKIANDAAVEGSTAASTAATQGQLQEVSKVANAGWTASDGTNSISVKPNETLNFVGDENLTVSADGTDKKLKVSLNDNITLGEGPNQIQLNGAPGANDPALSVGTDKFVVDQDGSLSVSDKFNVDAETGNIYAANNSGSAIVMNDDSVAFSADGNGVAVSDEGILLNTNGLDKDIRLVTKGTTVSVDKDGATFTNTNTNETTNINGGTINVGDKLVVDQDGTTTIAVNDGTVMGNNTTMTVNKDGVSFSAYGNGTTVIDGQTIYAGGVVINNNGSGTINGLTNTTWDDELAKQVANSEELQGTAATQGQLQQAVNEVAEVANAGWNAKAGGNTINVKPNETLNFEGDGNITVSATSGTSSELKFGLNHNITLDNVKDKNTMLVINTDGREGYIPDNYKDSNEDAEDFIGKHGGFAIYYANPSLTTGDMTGTFGVTTDGVVHAKDVISYYSASSGSQSDVIRYSLNDVGDIVTQISHAVFDEGVGNTGMEYTLISDFEDEADKDSPFDAKEGKTRTIGLAVRQDGAVIVGAVVNDEGISSDRGIRINAENDSDGNNKATITGLENTEWKPKAPEQTPQAKMATFAANDGTTTTETSRAATEAQLDDLYSSVVGYNVENGSVNTRHITLGGMDPNNAYDSKTYKGGVILDNVAYASGTDGSEAVNVDYLNDAINNAVKDGGAISDSDRHLQEGTYHVNDQGEVELIVADEKGENRSTVTIDNIANKNDITNLDNKIDNTFNDLNDKINNIDNVETDVKGGNINEDGTISLKTENEDGTTTNVTLKGQLTDSGVVQEGTTFDKETGTLTITSQDKYSGKTSSVTVDGIASTDVVGVTTKEELADKYKAADEDGNATTAYITESESMVEADVALDHAIQDVAGTSYANDMVLSNRIDSVEKRLGNVEERIDKVGAMAAAIANLRTMGFDPEAPTEIAIGVGQYKSETGIAIGVFHYPNQDFMLSASLSSSGDELMGGIGATWKLGRKSAAERAKDEEARHLEQAEEMKKLAQQEKVKAQAQRHAKLLAERQQASQKNA